MQKASIDWKGPGVHRVIRKVVDCMNGSRSTTLGLVDKSARDQDHNR